MSESERDVTTSVSRAHDLEEIAEYWDSHTLADRWDELPDADFEVRVAPRRRIAVASELYEKLEVRARIQGVSLETLANLWLAERLHEIG